MRRVIAASLALAAFGGGVTAPAYAKHRGPHNPHAAKACDTHTQQQAENRRVPYCP